MDGGSGAQIEIDGDVVTKVHRIGTDADALRFRLRVAARLGARPGGCLVPPLRVEPELVPGPEARWQTRWPRVEVVSPDPDRAPWAQAGRVLAALHQVSVSDVGTVPVHGGGARLPRALDRVADLESAAVLRRAATGLPASAWQPGTAERPVTVVHGDSHLGQLGRMPGEQQWRLIDIDDLGLGDPAWDLARPAGFWAAGLVDDDGWTALLEGYRSAGGPALPPAPADPWQVLEPLARAAIITAAAADLAAGCADETAAALLFACARMPS